MDAGSCFRSSCQSVGRVLLLLRMVPRDRLTDLQGLARLWPSSFEEHRRDLMNGHHLLTHLLEHRPC